MKNFFTVLLIGVLIFVVLILVMLLIGYGLQQITEVIPCNILLYVETGLLFIVAVLIALVVNKPSDGEI